jgi:hypothetical protein
MECQGHRVRCGIVSSATAFAVTHPPEPARFSTPRRAGLLDRQTLGKQHAHMWDRLATDPKPLKGFISKYDSSTSAH